MIFPDLEEGILADYMELVAQLKRYDTKQADKYLRMVRHG